MLSTQVFFFQYIIYTIHRRMKIKSEKFFKLNTNNLNPNML